MRYNVHKVKTTTMTNIHLPALIFFLNLAVDFTYTILKYASVIIIIIYN